MFATPSLILQWYRRHWAQACTKAQFLGQSSLMHTFACNSTKKLMRAWQFHTWQRTRSVVLMLQTEAMPSSCFASAIEPRTQLLENWCASCYLRNVYLMKVYIIYVLIYIYMCFFLISYRLTRALRVYSFIAHLRIVGTSFEGGRTPRLASVVPSLLQVDQQVIGLSGR